MTSVLLDIEQGTLKGTTATDLNGKKYYAFFRIPYAKPPIGELRFKAPEPPEKWFGIREANKDGGECFSRDNTGKVLGSEDCLVLNVYTPELPENDARLKPVMIWIHGGAFTMGSNSSQTYGPDYLITGDVVIVAINYRLGVLGFLSLDDPNVGVPGNAASKDTVMALKWVQANIKDFGGDPSNVTVFGESAGGIMTHLLVLSPMAKGLFHKAIVQSGCALNPFAIGKSCGRALAQVLECPYSDEKDILRYLQELPPEKLLEGQEKLSDKFTPDWVRFVSPIVEKVSPHEPAILSENPADILVECKYNKVPLMIGYTTREGYVFDLFIKMNLHKRDAIIDFETFIPNNFNVEKGSIQSKSIAEKIKKHYFGDKSPCSENSEELCILETDTSFVRGTYTSAKHHAASSTEPLYLYRFSVDAGLNWVKMLAGIKSPGAGHGDDLGYLFRAAVMPLNAIRPGIEEKTIRRMVTLWTNFAKTGNPNPVEDATWKPVSKDEINFLDIGETLTSDINPEKERMEFWDDIVQLIPEACKY